MRGSIKAVIVGVAAVVVAIIAASSATSATSSIAGKKLCFVGAANSHPYETPFNTEFKKRAAQAKLKLIYMSQEFKAQTGAAQIRACITRKPDVIVLNGFDPSAYTSSILAAKAAHIPLIVVDGPLDKQVYPLITSWTGPNSLQEGHLAGKLLDKGMNKQGKIVVLLGFTNSKVTTDRQNGFLDQLKADGSKIKILGSVYANFDQQDALVASRNLITRFGSKIQGVYALDDIMATGFLQAYKESGLNGKPVVVGMGGETTAFHAMAAGTQYGTVYQSPKVDADLAFSTAAAVLAGKSVPPLRYIPTPIVTAANMAQYKPAF